MNVNTSTIGVRRIVRSLQCAFVIVFSAMNAFAQSIPANHDPNQLIFRSSEKLYFLATTDRSDFDFQLAPPCSVFGSIQPNGEWYCRYLSGATDGELVTFRDSVDLEYLREASDAITDATSSHPGELVIDLIYRLDGDEVLHSGDRRAYLQTDTSAAFEVQASLGSTEDSMTHIARQFGWRDYTTQREDPHELRSLTRFPAAYGFRYAVLSMRLPLPNGTAKRGTLTLRLISKHRCGIYIRGFRVRTTIADEVLRGAFDRVCLTKQSESAAPETLPLSDRTLEHFRVISYLDWLQFKKTGIHPFGHVMVGADNLSKYRYRAVYESQNGIPPDYERP